VGDKVSDTAVSQLFDVAEMFLAAALTRLSALTAKCSQHKNGEKHLRMTIADGPDPVIAGAPKSLWRS
jgi:hypothetical protein